MRRARGAWIGGRRLCLCERAPESPGPPPTHPPHLGPCISARTRVWGTLCARPESGALVHRCQRARLGGAPCARSCLALVHHPCKRPLGWGWGLVHALVWRLFVRPCPRPRLRSGGPLMRAQSAWAHQQDGALTHHPGSITRGLSPRLELDARGGVASAHPKGKRGLVPGRTRLGGAAALGLAGPDTLPRSDSPETRWKQRGELGCRGWGGWEERPCAPQAGDLVPRAPSPRPRPPGRCDP